VSLWATAILGYLHLRQDDDESALAIFSKSCQGFKESSFVIGVIYTLEGMALLALKQNQPEKACQLLAWADSTRLGLNNKRPPIEQNNIALKQAELQSLLDESCKASARVAGKAMNMEEAIAFAFGSN
jgi:hypothetical protein